MATLAHSYIWTITGFPGLRPEVSYYMCKTLLKAMLNWFTDEYTLLGHDGLRTIEINKGKMVSKTVANLEHKCRTPGVAESPWRRFTLKFLGSTACIPPVFAQNFGMSCQWFIRVNQRRFGAISFGSSNYNLFYELLVCDVTTFC